MQLNRLDAYLEPMDTATVTGIKGVAIVVDGRPLADLAGDVECAEIRAGKTEGPVGTYLPMTVVNVRGPAHFLGQPEVSQFGDGDTVLLGCICGTWDCWPLSAHIDVRHDVVEWRGFRHGFREWDYQALGPFVFDRAAYEEQFAAIDWSDTGIPPGGW